MPQYIVRVELHDAEPLDYVGLHASMANQGFSTVVPTVNGKKFELPRGEYYILKGRTPNEILKMVKKATKETGFDAHDTKIVVILAKGGVVAGLDQVE